MKIKQAILPFIYLTFLCVNTLICSLAYALDNNSQNTTISAIYTKQEIVSHDSALEIEVDETVSLTGFDNITQVLVIDPKKIIVIKISPQELSVTGLKVGFTFVHVWDNGEVMTLRLNIKHKGFQAVEKAEEEIKATEKGQPIRVSYIYNLAKMQSKSHNPTYEWKIQDESHQFDLSGDMPYGNLEGSFRYLFRKTQEGLTDDTDHAYFKMENDDFSVRGGDIYPYFSDLTLPRTHLQALQFSSGEKHKHFKYDFVAGSTGYYLWGSRLSNFGQIENQFYGLRTEIMPQEDISFFATYMGSAKHVSRAAHDLASFGGTYKIGERLYFETEAAVNNKNRTAFMSNLKLNIDKLDFGITYRDITVDYLNLTGNASYRGRRGIYTKAKFNPYKDLSFSGTFDLYQNRLFPDPDSVDKGNKDITFSSKYVCRPTNTTFLMSLFHRDNRGQQFPVVNFGQSYEINQTLKDVLLLGDVYGYVRYEPSRYKNFITGESNYLDKTLRLGMRIMPISGLSLSAQETLNYREWPVRDYSTSPRRLELSARYNSRIHELPIFLGMSIGYQIDSHVNQDKISIILGENRLKVGADIRYNVAPDLNCFLNLSWENIKGSTDPTLDRFQTEIYGGLRFLWDTGIFLPGWGSVKGFVFKDLNGNGVMDKGEKPIKGAGIMVDKKKLAITNKRGFYRIPRIKEGLRLITLDLNDIPESYRPTTSVNVKAAIKKMGSQEINFGVTPNTEIKGFIFNDINRNKVFDNGIDEVLRDVLVSLEDGTMAYTDFYGYFNMYNVKPGEHKITVHMDTLPDRRLLPEGPISHSINIEEGQKIETRFIFYALRAVAGRIYVDLDVNNRYTSGEGMEGVELSWEGKVVKTDDQGYFIFRNLPHGKVKININKNTVPEKYSLEKDYIEVDLKKRTDIRDDVNLKLNP